MDQKEVERLVETHLWLDLKEAEEDLVAGKEVQIEVTGETMAEKISIIAAALWIVEKMRERSWDFATALSAYRQIIR